MAKKWIQGAIKHPGALHATAVRLGFVSGPDSTLGPAVLGKLEAHGQKTGDSHLLRQVALARTLRRL